MDLKSGYPFWAIRNGLMRAFPPLHEHLACDVVVIGGGITGALIADELARHGHGVVVLEQRDVAWGSTAASTALLQYEIDTHMVDLAGKYGERTAALAYDACASSIHDLQALAADVGDVDFAKADSLYYASSRRHARKLRDEHALRRKHGFDVTWLDRDAIIDAYGFEAPCAILSTLAARIDPYRMTYRLLDRVRKRGGEIFDRTCVDDIRATARGVSLRTTEGFEVRADHAVIAAGYASQHWLRDRIAVNRSSYAFITDPIERERLGALRNTMLWESARPYLYLRTTGDDRLLVGGEDDAVDIPAKRDLRVDRKALRLAKEVGNLFPHLPIRPAFAWAGTFAETRDGLPFFGPHPQYGPRVHFAMAYGGNGITFSMAGGGLIRALVERRKHPLSSVFGFKRLG
ncbi:MAG: FAD-binding oxidoreductase [Luteimonas sp.]|nr:FAD-binding oxidoreductase [Luteimonas sp.]